MSPTASKQSRLRRPLNEVFGSPAQVRVLRVLTADAAVPLHPSEVAQRAGLTESGARRALQRLTGTGLVRGSGNGEGDGDGDADGQGQGQGRPGRFVFCREGALAEEVARLFEVERDGGGGPDRAGPPAGETSSLGNGRLDPESPQFPGALVALLEENLSVVRRARENVRGRLRQPQNGCGHDLWEWQKILDTFSLPRLLHFLASDSPRAVRLRKCSPFPSVLSEEENARLSELAFRPH